MKQRKFVCFVLTCAFLLVFFVSCAKNDAPTTTTEETLSNIFHATAFEMSNYMQPIDDDILPCYDPTSETVTFFFFLQRDLRGYTGSSGNTQ